MLKAQIEHEISEQNDSKQRESAASVALRSTSVVELPQELQPQEKKKLKRKRKLEKEKLSIFLFGVTV